MDNQYVEKRQKKIDEIKKKLIIFNNDIIKNVRKYLSEGKDNFVNYNLSKDNPILIKYNQEELQGIKGFLEYKSLYSIDGHYDTDCCKRTMEILCMLLSKEKKITVEGYSGRYILFNYDGQETILETETMNTSATEFNKDIRKSINSFNWIDCIPEKNREYSLEYLFNGKYGMENGKSIQNSYNIKSLKEKNERLKKYSEEDLENLFSDKNNNGKYLWILTYYSEIINQQIENKYRTFCEKCFNIGNMILVPFGCNAMNCFGSKSTYKDRFDMFYNGLSNVDNTFKYSNYKEWKECFDSPLFRKINCIDMYFRDNKAKNLDDIKIRCDLIYERGQKVFERLNESA